MTTVRVLAVSSPIYAHALNAVPFVEGLLSRGAEVHWAVAEPWAGPGVTAAPVWSTGEIRPFFAGRGRLGEVSARFDWLLADAARRVEAVQRVVDEVRPDIVLVDALGYAGALVCERSGLPWVSFGDGPLHFPDPTTPPFGAGLPYRTQRPWLWRNAAVQVASRRVVMGPAQRRYDELRRTLGLSPDATPVLEAAVSPLLHLHCGAPELEYPRAALPAEVHFVGALRPPPAAHWEQPPWWPDVVAARDGEVVVVTQGTLRPEPDEVLLPALRAVQRSGRAAVLTTGAADPASLGGPGRVSGGSPRSAIAVESFVPYERVLPYASAFVTNGGWTGVLLALAHGVPVLQVGSTEEKADIGRRVAWAGAGVHLGGGRPGVRRLRAALERVESPSCREGARRIAESLASLDPARDGADLILRLAHRRGAAAGG
jgi:UDP:flavonoid glycosyltransferase YjiC (YdhE family)